MDTVVVQEYRNSYLRIWYRSKRDREYVPVDERFLAKKIPRFDELTEKARLEATKEFFSHCRIQEYAELKLLGTVENPACDEENLKKGAKLLLSATELFENHEVGHRLVCLTLTSARCESLRRQMNDFRPIVMVKTNEDAAISVFTEWFEALEPRKKWKKRKNHVKIHREVILDFRNPTIIGKKLLDFNHCTLVANKKKFQTPIPYDDVAIAVIAPSVQHLHELELYTEYAGMVLIGAVKGKYDCSVVASKQAANVDDSLRQKIRENSLPLASVLDDWRYGADDENAWAMEIADTVKKSFGKPDSRYRSVTFDPVKLQDAVYLAVFVSFLKYSLQKGWISVEEAEKYLVAATEVFAPKAAAETGKMEEPDIFLDILRRWSQAPERKIASQEVEFPSKDIDGAIRDISGEKYLVLPEDWLKKVYLKEIRRTKCDCSFAERPDWMQKIQREWCEAGILKHHGKNYRYRYDLYGTGSRDKTYVLAIPLTQLKS